VFRVTRQYRFSASHRLHTAALSLEANRALYGKCNNPYGHGHNYVMEVSARGPLDEATGRAVDTDLLDGLVTREVLEPFSHRDLNAEVEAFASIVPTSENLGVVIFRRLKENWGTAFPGEWPRLEKVRIAETERNIFEIENDEIE
jgi:6-pyruvoyltetrahydropterin/6-carboxytetrahydropterin synthase